MCGECVDGWYRLQGKCRKCNSALNALFAILLFLGAVAVVTGLLLFSMSEGLRYKFAAAMMSLNALQISAIYGRLELDWGSVADAYFEVASGLNLNMEISSPECSLARGVDTWVFKWVLTLLLPVWISLILLGVAGVVWGLIKGQVWWFGSKTQAQLVSAGGRTLFQLLVLLFLPLSNAAFAPFGCRKREDGEWSMDADPARSCYTKAWWAGLFPVALLAIGGYAIAIPVSVFVVLRNQRASLAELDFALRFGFLVGRFKTSNWWFEVALMARKLGVVVAMSLFWTDGAKANSAFLVLAVCVGHLLYSQPYISRFHNGLAVVVLSATSVVLFGGTWADRTGRRVVVLTGITINVLAIVVGNAVDLWLIAKSEEKAENEWMEEGRGEDVVETVGMESLSFGSVGTEFLASEIVVSDMGGSVGSGGVGEESVMTFSEGFDSVPKPPPVVGGE